MTNEKEKDIYKPVPVESYFFPVGSKFIDLSERYMHMIQWHWHEEVELILVHSGCAKLKLSNESVVLSTGDCAYINQNQLHSVHTVGDEVCRIYTLKFHPVFLFGYGQTPMSAKYLTPVVSSPTLHYHVFYKDDPSAAETIALIRACIESYEKKAFGFELTIKSCLCTLWQHLMPFAAVDTGAAAASTQQSLDNARIKQALQFIEKKHMEPITLDDIAASIHVSKSECCRCFQRSIGITPFEYLMKFRIFESTRKIMRRDEAANSISTLAVSVGFNSVSYYNKLFRKYLNCTPSQYKKSLNKDTVYLP